MANEVLRRSITTHWRKQFLHSFQNTPQAQQALLMRILRTQAKTAIGSFYTFAQIRSIQDYQQSFPISSYEDLSPWIARIISGEVNVLTSEPVSYLQVTSSTTTGKQKFIPSTATYRRKVWQMLLASQGFLHDWATSRGICCGRGIVLGSTLPFGITGNAQLPYGPASAYFIAGAALIWRAISRTPFELMRVADPEARQYLYWRFALQETQCSFISAPYMAALLTFAALLFKRSEELIRDIADGTLSKQLSLSPNEQRNWSARLRRSRTKAKQLEALAALHNGLIPRFIWPDLGWVFTVYGPSFQSYERMLDKWYSPNFFWGMPYLACEGIIGIPFIGNSYSHLPALQVSFLEFIPEEAWADTQPRTVLLYELETNRRYDVVLTGWNGIYRYRLGDIVEVDGEFCGVPALKIISRSKTVLSISWEKTSEEQVVQAVEASMQEYGAEMIDFVVDIDTASVPARYCLWVEPAQMPSQDIQKLQTVFDIHLCNANPNYATVRKNTEIGKPLVRILPSGTFERFRQYQQHYGMPVDQMKILHSIPQWDYIRSQTHYL